MTAKAKSRMNVLRLRSLRFARSATETTARASSAALRSAARGAGAPRRRPHIRGAGRPRLNAALSQDGVRLRRFTPRPKGANATQVAMQRSLLMQQIEEQNAKLAMLVGQKPITARAVQRERPEKWVPLSVLRRLCALLFCPEPLHEWNGAPHRFRGPPAKLEACQLVDEKLPRL
jgi:hypothetical protein